MDPDSILMNIRDLVIATLAGEPCGAELAEAIDGLDKWLILGGFLPAAWQPKP